MSDDTVFRSKIEPKTEEIAVHPKGDVRTSEEDDGVEVPYLDYQKEHARPYTVDYFKLGENWDDVFHKEVTNIEDYVSDKIDSGEIANSVTAIKDLLKGMEKLNNLTKEERSIVKIEVLSNYIDFLTKNEKVKENLRRYNSG